MKTLHALLVAIDNYPIAHHRLSGCVNDRNEFKDYLERHYGKSEDLQLRIKTLTDSEASKKGVIKGFSHFEKAKNGDICVFYYSGHGSRAPAPPEFWHLDPDRMNESMVCYDSRTKNGKDLMDKELSYLFWKATNGKDLHFVALFDCCHSGTISKDVEVVPRMAEPSPTPNRLEDYYGYKDYKQQKVNGQLQYSPPRGNILQFAGSKEYETAKELRIMGTSRGIFTYSLIEALEQTGGQSSYNQLLRTLQVRVDNKVKEQTPQLITVKPSDKDLLFLGGAAKPSPPYFMIDFHKGKWVMDAGTIQGIPSDGGRLVLEDGDQVTIDKVLLNHSEIRGMEGKDTNLSYKAFADKLSFKKMPVAFAKGSKKETGEMIRQVIKESAPVYIELTDKLEDAAYWIRTADGSFQLTLPDQERPVFRRVQGFTEENARVFLNDVEKVGQWRNLLELANPRSSIRDDEFEIELHRTVEAGNFEDDAETETVDWRDLNVFSYDYIDGEWKNPAFRLKIKNTGHRKLFASALYMLNDFGITNKFLPVQELNPGEEVWMTDVFDGYPYKTIPLAVDDAYHSWGITEVHEYVKVIVSTDPQLNTERYNQDSLELDVKQAKGVRAGRERLNQPKQHDWLALDIEMVIVRPMDQQPLQAGKPVALLPEVSVTSPGGLKAKVSLAGLKTSERAVFPGAEGMAAPGRLWGTEQNDEAKSYEFTRGVHTSPGPSVMELYDVEGKEEVTADSPLLVDIHQQLADNEFVLPIGFDAETGLYYPLGTSSQEGVVRIETLPDESPTGTKSLGGSIKIFFQKVLSKAGIEYEYPQLAMAVFQDENSEDFEYVADANRIQEAVGNASRIGVFIHGIIGDTLEMTKSVKRPHNENGDTLDKHFDLVLTFDYENLNTPISETAELLGQRLAAVGLGLGHDKHLTLIAHSMGGLVSRWFIEKKGGNEIVSHLVQLGTPNGGSPWASVYELASVLLARAINGATFLQPYILPLNFLGRYVEKVFVTLKQMHPTDSDFLGLLNDGTDPGIPYSIVAGNTQLIPAMLEEKHKNLLKKLVARFKKRGHFEALDLLLFKTANDIAVAVGSIASIEGADNWATPPRTIEVPCDHISYFGDPEGLKALANAVLGE